jgi:hypothetical protein
MVHQSMSQNSNAYLDIVTPCLDVDIQGYNSELETALPNTSVWMIIELLCGIILSFQTVFTPTSARCAPSQQFRAETLRIRWNSRTTSFSIKDDSARSNEREGAAADLPRGPPAGCHFRRRRLTDDLH